MGGLKPYPAEVQGVQADKGGENLQDGVHPDHWRLRERGGCDGAKAGLADGGAARAPGQARYDKAP